MNKLPTPKDWQKFFLEHGISEELALDYVDYAQKLYSNNMPVIFESEHLAQLIGINRSTLVSIINAPESYYREFHIPKKKGGQRKICAPYPSLLACQRWIYQSILLNKKVHHCAHGFAPNKSIITNAKKHTKKTCILKMDFMNFFPSIPINWVINFFHEQGYEKNVSFFLASLCCKDGRLAQGAATSPYLSNILLQSFDKRIFKLCKKLHLDYTRYADDITISGEYIPHKVISIIENIVDSFGLKVNPEKTRLKIGEGQKIVTGISVSGTSIALPRKEKREIKKEMHFIKKFGHRSHMSKKKIRQPFYLESLLGRLGYWLQIEPNNKEAQEYHALILSILKY